MLWCCRGLVVADRRDEVAKRCRLNCHAPRGDALHKLDSDLRRARRRDRDTAVVHALDRAVVGDDWQRCDGEGLAHEVVALRTLLVLLLLECLEERSPIGSQRRHAALRDAWQLANDGVLERRQRSGVAGANGSRVRHRSNLVREEGQCGLIALLLLVHRFHHGVRASIGACRLLADCAARTRHELVWHLARIRRGAESCACGREMGVDSQASRMAESKCERVDSTERDLELRSETTSPRVPTRGWRAAPPHRRLSKPAGVRPPISSGSATTPDMR